MIDAKTNWLIGYLLSDGDIPPEIAKSEDALKEYLKKPYYASKMKRLADWSPDKGELYELVMTLFRITLEGEQTYQALIGMVTGKIGCYGELNKAKCAAEVIAICCNAGLLNITKRYSGYVISTEYELEDEIPEIDKHQTLFTVPKEKTDTNQLLGGRLKYHDMPTCLDHINRMNSIPLSLNEGVLHAMKEKPDNELDTPEKAGQWKAFVKGSYDKYIELVKGVNIFYLEWNNDLRGRCYSDGYYINPQGSGFKKAICQLANKELLNDV